LAPLPRNYKKILVISLPLMALFIGFIAYMYEHTSTTQYCGTSCHIMKPAYETSFHNVHREVNNVNCKDCHIPQDNIPLALVYKGYSGAKDIYKNTFDPPDVLHATEWSRQVIQKNCIRCHRSVVERVQISDGKRCFECHRGIPHDQSPLPFSLQKISTPIR
jgi:cytochrome c nitrite reductase small subunit